MEQGGVGDLAHRGKDSVAARQWRAMALVKEGQRRGLLQLLCGAGVLLDLLDREEGGRVRPALATVETKSREDGQHVLPGENGAGELADKRSRHCPFIVERSGVSERAWHMGVQ
jgi:hypothetical protein